MTQLDYYSHLLYSLVVTASLVGAVVFLLAVSYAICILFPHAGPRK